MSDKVDVLARMDAAIGSMQMFHLGSAALEEARAAVAELIEAVKASVPDLADSHLSGHLSRYDRLRAALANVGAAK